MRNEIRKIITVFLFRMALSCIPEGEFKDIYRHFIINNIGNL